MIRPILLSLSILLLGVLALPSGRAQSAQTPPPVPHYAEGVDVVAEGGSVTEPEVTEAEYAAIWSAIERSVAGLEKSGALPRLAEDKTRLAWPLLPIQGESVTDFHYAVTANFVDHNSAYPDQLLDYACGVATYDTFGGYNHKGTDFLLVPFPWNKMDNDEVAVIAAAPGVIVYKQDGQFDRSCGSSSQPWNAMYIRHNDGSTAWYGHLKNGSLTAKGVGEWVATGERLGLVGSSGSSTTPHLHFELYDRDGKLLDPFAGACNATTAESWWIEQPAYLEPGINKMTTGDAAPETPACPSPGDSHEQTTFSPGQSVYFASYFRHFAPGMTANYTLARPDGSIFRQWSYTWQGSLIPAAWVYRYYTLDADAPVGLWSFTIDFAGKSYTKTFGVVGKTPTTTATATANATATATPTATLAATVGPTATATATQTSTTTPLPTASLTAAATPPLTAVPTGPPSTPRPVKEPTVILFLPVIEQR